MATFLGKLKVKKKRTTQNCLGGMGHPRGGMGHPKKFEWSSLKIISIKMLAALHHPFIHYVTLDSLGDNFPNHAQACDSSVF